MAYQSQIDSLLKANSLFIFRSSHTDRQWYFSLAVRLKVFKYRGRNNRTNALRAQRTSTSHGALDEPAGLCSPSAAGNHSSPWPCPWHPLLRVPAAPRPAAPQGGFRDFKELCCFFSLLCAHSVCPQHQKPLVLPQLERGMEQSLLPASTTSTTDPCSQERDKQNSRIHISTGTKLLPRLAAQVLCAVPQVPASPSAHTHALASSFSLPSQASRLLD